MWIPVINKEHSSCMYLQCTSTWKTVNFLTNMVDYICHSHISSSSIRLRPLCLLLASGNHHPISLRYSYIFSPFRFLIKFFSLLLSINCICSSQFISYSVNFSLILKIPNCSLMLLLLLCPKMYILPLILKISF